MLRIQFIKVGLHQKESAPEGKAPEGKGTRKKGRTRRTDQKDRFRVGLH